MDFFARLSQGITNPISLAAYGIAAIVLVAEEPESIVALKAKCRFFPRHNVRATMARRLFNVRPAPQKTERGRYRKVMVCLPLATGTPRNARSTS